jgi:hypothetical protein
MYAPPSGTPINIPPVIPKEWQVPLAMLNQLFEHYLYVKAKQKYGQDPIGPSKTELYEPEAPQQEAPSIPDIPYIRMLNLEPEEWEQMMNHVQGTLQQRSERYDERREALRSNPLRQAIVQPTMQAAGAVADGVKDAIPEYIVQAFGNMLGDNPEGNQNAAIGDDASWSESMAAMLGMLF